MILSKKLNQNFINCFLKDWKNLSRAESDMLWERQQLLNKKFNFTKKRIQKLQSLSDMFKTEEQRIKPHADRISSLQANWLSEKLIDDYEIEVHIECWNNNYYRKQDESFYKNPFFIDRSINLFHKIDNDSFYNDNWNEFQFMEEHILRDQFHCYSLHHLYDHTILSWWDIMKIDNVWIEIQVINQFTSDVKK
jgi:hypothetical protein